ncbi:MAG: right-handed parallel beta-helix repeat-containing protein, partial [Candidatus Bipolaricaulota bacterium]|nr:right-handed parallel beta-helix repeat-containing protein [Candidatus Bipolaricaulota bacterium]
AHVTLQDSIISGFSGNGLVVHNATVELINSQIAGTKLYNLGLMVTGTSRVSLQESTVSGHSGGILVAGPAQVTLQDSLVVGNEAGMEITYYNEQPAVVTIERSQISSNRSAGIHNRGSIVKLSDSFVIGNGVDPKCHQLPLKTACSGSGIILLEERDRLELRTTEIRNNANWGVAAYLPQCGAPSYVPPFSVEVIFEDKNIIENNNRLGKLNGMGNPGNHPFKNLPDGQVCLP